MLTQNKVIFFICIVLSSCGIFFPGFKRPTQYDFKYYNSQNNINSFYTTSVYYWIDENSTATGVNTLIYIIKFFSDGTMHLQAFGGADSISTINFGINYIVSKKNDPKAITNKGYYNIKDNLINFEISLGDPAHGYYIIEYKALLVDETRINIQQINYKKIHNAMENLDVLNSKLKVERQFTKFITP